MAQQMKYVVGIQADISQANASIAQLQKDLQAVSRINVKLDVPNSELKAAAEAAKEIQSHLTKATNATTGQLDLTKFTNSLKSSGQSVQELSSKLLAAGSSGRQAFISMAQAVGQAQVPIKTMNKTVADLATTLKNTVKWQLSSNLVHGLQGALQGALNYAKGLDESLNNIRIVTGQSADQMSRFAVEANAAAKKLSTTTKAYTDAALIYYQQGDSDSSVAKKAEITTKAANVAFTATTKEMSEMLTAVWNSYKVGEDELQRYVDIMAALGATTATSTEEIATAMQKVAATASTVGVSMEQMSSMIATVSSVTRQSAETIGTSFKTLLARIGDLKLGGTDEDGIGLGQVSSQLEAVGIKILDTSGNLRDMGDIIEEMGAKWGKMGKAQQTALAQAVAGKRQYTQLIALMENMDKYEKNMKTANNATGTLDKQAATYAESWEAASARVQASLEGIYQKLLDSSGFVKILNVINSMIGLVDRLVDGFGGLSGIIAAIGSIATQVFSKQIGKFLNDIPQKITNLTKMGRQQNLQRSQNELMTGMNEVRDTQALTQSQHTQLDSTAQVMTMNQQLSMQAPGMSQESIAEAQAAIESYKQITQEIINLQQAAEQAEGKIAKLSTAIAQSAGDQLLKDAVKNGEVTGEQIDAIIQKVQQFKSQTVDINLFNGASGTGEDKTVQVSLTFDQIVAKAKEASQELVAVNGIIEELGTKTETWGKNFADIDASNLKSTVEELSTYVDKAFADIDPGKATELKNQLQAALEMPNIEDARLKLQEVFNTINTSLEGTAARTSVTKEQLFAALDGFKDKCDPNLIEELKNQINNWGETNQEAAGHQDEATEAMKRYNDALVKSHATTGEMITMGFSAVTAFISLTRASLTLGQTWASNKSIGDKLLSSLMILPAIFMAARAATKLYAAAHDRKAAAELLSAAGSHAAATGVRAFTKALLTSPLFIIAAILMAVAAAFTAIAAVVNANAEKQKEYSKAVQETNKALQEEVEQQKKDREELEESYNSWAQYEEARKNGAEVGDDYVSATEAVLAALDMEAYKVLLTAGKYDQLAAAIENANNKRRADSVASADKLYQDAKTNAVTYARTYKDDDNDTFKSSGVWNNRFVLHLAADKFKNQWNKDQMGGMSFETFYSDVLGLTGSKDSGFNDIRFNSASSDELVRVYNRAVAAEERFGSALTSLPAWIDFMDWLSNTGGLIQESYEERQRAHGADFMAETYGTSLRPEDFDRETMAASVKQHLISKGYAKANDPHLDDIVNSIVDDYVLTLGDSFTSAIQNAEQADLITADLKDQGVHENIIRAARNYIRDVLHLDPDEVMAGVTDTAVFGTVAANWAPDDDGGELATNMVSQYLAGQVRSAQTTTTTLGQRLYAAEELAGTFQKKPENKQTITDLFNEYYSTEGITDEAEIQRIEAQRQAALERFWASSSDAQIAQLEEMVANSDAVIRSNWERTMPNITDADVSRAGAAAANAALLGGGVVRKKFGFDISGYNRNDMESRAQMVTDANALIDQKEQILQEALANGAADQLDYNAEDIAQARAEVQALNAANGDYVTLLNAAGAEWDSSLIPSIERASTAMKDFNKVAGLVKKTAVDTAEEWQALEEVTGETLDSLKTKMAGTTDAEWANWIADKAEEHLNATLISQSAAAGMGAEELNGREIVTDEAWEAAQQEIAEMRNQANQLTFDATAKSIDKTLDTVDRLQDSITNLDLNNLPTAGKAFDDLSLALKAAGINMDDFVNADRITQLDNLQAAEENLYKVRLNQQEQLINAKKAQLDAAQTEEERVKLAEELYELEQDQYDLQLESEAVGSAYDAKRAAVYKDQISVGAAAAQAEIDKLTTKMANATSIAKSMIEALDFGNLDFEALNELAAFDKENGTNFAEQWETASSALERAAIASKVYQEAITASQSKADKLVAAEQEIAGLSELSTHLSTENDFYTYLGQQSNLSNDAKALLSQAYSNIQGQIYDGMSSADINTLLMSEIQKLKAAGQTAADEVVAQYKSTMQGMFKGMADAERAQAESVVDTWVNAFETIKEAKLKVAEGGSLAELLMGDADGVMTVLETIMSGLDDSMSQEEKLAEATRLFYAGGTDLQNALQYGSISQQQRLSARGYDLLGSFDQSGQFTAAANYEAARDAWVQAHISEFEDTEQGTATEAAQAAYAEAFRQTMKELGLTDTQITDAMKNTEGAWTTVTNKLSTFASATQIAAQALENFAKIEQAKAERDREIDLNTKKAEKAEALAEAAQTALNRESGTTVTESIIASGVSLEDFARAAGMEITADTTQEDITSYLNALTEEELSSVFTTQREAATGFYNAVVAAGDAFLAKFIGKDVVDEATGITGTGEFVEMKGTAAAEEEARDTQEETHDTVEKVNDTRTSTDSKYNKENVAKQTTQRISNLSSLWQNGPTTASDYRVLMEAGVGSTVGQIQAMSQANYRAAVERAMDETLQNTISQSSYDAAIEHGYEEAVKNKTVVSDEEYAEMQARRQDFRDNKATIDFNDYNQGIQNTLSDLQTLNSAFSSIDLESMPLKGSKAWEKLDAQLKEAGSSLDAFTGLSRADQIKKLGELATANYQSQIDQYDELIAKADGYANDASLSESARAEWAQRALELRREQAAVQDEMNAQDLKTLQQLSEYYDAEYAKIADRQAELQEKADKAKTRADTMADLVLDNTMTMTQRAILGSAASAFEYQAGDEAENGAVGRRRRGEAAVAQYAAAANEALNVRDEALQNIQNSKNSLTGEAFMRATSGRAVSKTEFTDLLSDMNLAPEIAGQLQAAWDSALGSLSNDALSNLSWADVAVKLQEELSKAADSASEEATKAVAEIQDAMIAVYANISAQELSIAQAAVDAWRSAFDEISALRKAIISGDGVSDAILGSLDSFTNAVNAYKGSIDEFIAAYRAGTLAAQDFETGTPEEYAEKIKRSMGLDKLFDENGQLIKQEDLGEAFGIKKENFTKDGVFDEAAYNQAVQNATNPYLRAMLEGAGFESWEIDSIIAQYWAGSEDAVKAIQGAGDKMNEVADAYAELYTENAKIQEEQTTAEAAQAERQEEIDRKVALREEHETKLAKAEDLRELGYDMAARDTTGASAKSVLAGHDVNAQEVLDIVNKQFGTDYTDLEQVSENQWAEFARVQDEAAANEQKEIARIDGEIANLQAEIEAIWAALREKLVTSEEEGGFGLGEDNEYVHAVDQKLEQLHQETEEARQIAAEASSAAISAADNIMENSETSFQERSGLALDQWRALKESLEDKITLDIDSEQGQRELNELALKVALFNEGMDELQSISADTWKTLKDKTKKGTKEYKDQLLALQKTANKVLGVDLVRMYNGSAAAADDFVERHIEDFEKMANGTEKEARAAEEAVQDDLVAGFIAAHKEINDTLSEPIEVQVDTAGTMAQFDSLTNFFQNAFDHWDNMDDITIHADVEGAEASVIGAMQSMLNSGQMTADGINAALAAIGWEPEISYEPVTVVSSDAATGTSTVVDSAGNSYTVSTSALMNTDGQITLPVIKSASKGSGAKGGGSNAGGGGGGGDSPKHSSKAKKTERKENDRHHQINKLIDRQSNELDKLDKLKSRAYGANHIQAINDEINAMRKMIGLYEDQKKEIEAYIKGLEQLGTNVYGATIVDGVIQNQADLVREQVEKYNKAVDEWNSLSAEEQEKEYNKVKLQEAEAAYNDFLEWMREYEAEIESLRESMQEMADYVNQISGLISEQIQEKITLRIEIDERELESIDRVLSRYEGHLDKQAESFAQLQSKLNIYATWDETGAITGGELGKLIDRMKEADAEHQKYLDGLTQYGDDEWYLAEGLNDADYAEVLKEIQSQWVDILDNIQDVIDALGEVYSSMLDIAEEDLSHYTDQLDHINDTMESYIELQELMGQGSDPRKTIAMYEAQYSAMEAKLQQSTTHLNELVRERSNLSAIYESLTEDEKNGVYGQMLKDQIDDLESRILDAENEQLDNWKQTLELAQAILEQRTAMFLKDFDDAIDHITGSIGGLSALESDYEWYQQTQERYVSTSKELYEMAKLNRQINDSIADSTTKASKARLKALQEEINAMADKNQLTEYDIKMMQLQYKHALALQELEEAKNAKNIVRLTRDENGNYGYQYTANDDDISDARQKVDDALQEINELAANRVAELEQKQIETLRNYYDQVAEINADTTLSDEQRMQKLQELTQRCNDELLWIRTQYNNAESALLINQIHVQERYGQSIEENTGRLNDQLNAQMRALIMANVTTSNDLAAAIAEGGDLYNALTNYGQIVNQANQAAGHGADDAATSWDNLAQSVGSVGDQIDTINTNLGKVNEALKQEATDLTNAIDKWKTMGTALEDFWATADSIDRDQLQALISTLAGDFENEDVGGDGGNGGNGGNKTMYGYTWSFGGMYGTSLGFESKQKAKDAALQDIEEQFSEMIAEYETGEDDNGATEAVQRLTNQMKSAKQQFTNAVSKGVNQSGNNAIYTYATGGLADFTGPAWLDGTKQSPELILNDTDTQNMFNIIQSVRDLMNANVLGMLYNFGNLAATGLTSSTQELQQNVHITAEFPNATDRNEIAAAFEDIVNLATQYANRR